MSQPKKPHDQHDSHDDSLGAVEGERPSDPQRGNTNAPALDKDGKPSDAQKIAEDRIGANLDNTQG